MPTRVIQGERIGRQGQIRLGCSATLFNQEQDKILLTRRSDNGLWCLPGGGIDPGESIEETCIREVLEETGLRVTVRKILGIYSSPDWLVEYPDGNRVQIVAVNFAVDLIEGQATTTPEVTEIGYFNQQEIETLDLLINHRQRIQDAFSHHCEAFIR